MSVKNRAGKLKRHRRTCPAKHPYADRPAVVAGLAALVRKRGAVANQMQPYRCLACRRWHFGHKM